MSTAKCTNKEMNKLETFQVEVTKTLGLEPCNSSRCRVMADIDLPSRLKIHGKQKTRNQ